MGIKLIAFDLDGTFLRNDKTVSKRNLTAVARAAEKGIHIVPATGRLYEGMPDEIRDLPFVRYVIAINGAEIYDAKEKQILHRAELTSEEAGRILKYGEELEAICGCYLAGEGWMEAAEYKKIEEYITVPKLIQTIKRIYLPIENMKKNILDQGLTLQKIQYYFKESQKQEKALANMAKAFPDLEISSSLPNNMEINSSSANKGKGLKFLCEHLGIEPEECMAFGDGTNDISMILQAGIGVAMENAYPEMLSAAEYRTETNEQDGVAKMIERYLS